MELWVRTQCKKRLLQTTYLGYDFSESEQSWYIYSYPNGKVGLYKTEERCLEIIDDIQKLLLSANPKEAFILADCRNQCEFPHLENIINYSRESKFIAYDGEDGTNFQLIQPSVLVYEMPKE